MSFDEYANHIYQKYRLCVAIAVLKSKPTDLSSTQYLQQLKSKMADNMDDDDVTICSDDFMMDCDNESDGSATILKDFGGDERNGLGAGLINDGNEGNDNGQILQYLPEDLSQTTFYNSSQSQATLNTAHPTNNDVTYYDSDQTIRPQFHIKDNFTKINNDIEKPDNYQSFISNKAHKEDAKISKEPVLNENYSTTSNKNIISSNDVTNKDSNGFNDNPDLNKDSQKTILYSVHGFTQNYTHYSPSQNEIVIPKKHLYGASRNNHISTVQNVDNPDFSIRGDNLNTNATVYSQNDDIPHKTQETNDINQALNAPIIISKGNRIENMLTQNVYDVFDQNQNDFDDSESILKTQKKITKIGGIEQGNNMDCNATNLEHSQNIDDYFNDMQRFNDSIDFNETINDSTIDIHDINPSITSEYIQTNTNIPQNNDNTNKLDTQTTNLDKNQSVEEKISLKEVTQNDNFTNSSQNFGPNVNFAQENIGKTTKYEIVEEELDPAEIIPYKVLEELNKIKIFLRRRDRRMSWDGYSTDSGYRSDSQIRNSNRSALQLSGTSINQSAYCLFNHIMECPLVMATRDITSEIAQTLSQLIDRLHEEESYPPFLEELLDSTNILLRQVYRGPSNDDSEFMRKDEFVQRILLLNRSMHIQKHTIEKITNLLSLFHEKITDENETYELTNIDEIENASYIFHILEILIKKYIKIKNTSSQSNTQLSQDEEKILKKSSITDIWRKKWNPNLKISEGSRENRCVLKTCSEILNKIVVDCVNSYSIVAFAALKCFNSIQS